MPFWESKNFSQNEIVVFSGTVGPACVEGSGDWGRGRLARMMNQLLTGICTKSVAQMYPKGVGADMVKTSSSPIARIGLFRK